MTKIDGTPVLKIEYDIKEIGIRPSSSWFGWDEINAGTISATIRCYVIDSLERSLDENADVWIRLADCQAGKSD